MTKSQFGEKFNHDSWANDYNTNVTDESHPIRAGYAACLAWVAEKAGVSAESTVVDLGIGTGNLSILLPPCKTLTGVDLSTKMMTVAQVELPHLLTVQSDLLAYFDNAPPVDIVVSTYAIHHLTELEKTALLHAIDRTLRPGGRAVFGDLMFANANARTEAIAHYEQAGRNDIVFDIYDEFFWLIDEALVTMKKLGWQVNVTRFSDLSWGIAAQK